MREEPAWTPYGFEKRVYRYPSHLKSRPKLWMWSLRDLAILGCMLPVSILLAVWGKVLFPLGVTIGFAALSVRMEEEAVSDYIRRIVRYLVKPKRYVWQHGSGTDRKTRPAAAFSKNRFCI